MAAPMDFNALLEDEEKMLQKISLLQKCNILYDKRWFGVKFYNNCNHKYSVTRVMEGDGIDCRSTWAIIRHRYLGSVERSCI